MLPDPLKLGNVAPDILSSSGLGLVVKILVPKYHYKVLISYIGSYH